jgi:hypothetical protein
MAIRVFDFRCPLGHVTEHFVDSAIEEVQCHCECVAKRQIATPRVKLEGITGAFPGAAMAWEKRRESHMAKERKNIEQHGTYD